MPTIRRYFALLLPLLLLLSSSLSAADPLRNPSFEQHPGLDTDGTARYPAIPGWQGLGGEVQLQAPAALGLPASDGTTALQLQDALGVSQELSLLPGQWYRLNLGVMGLGAIDSDALDLLWDGWHSQLAADPLIWQRHCVDLQALTELTPLELLNASADSQLLVDDLHLQPSPFLDANQLVNRSFEQHPPFAALGQFSAIPGWSASKGQLV